MACNDPLTRINYLRIAIDRVRTGEMAILNRLRQARHWAKLSRREDAGLRRELDLFLGATAIIDDAIRDLERDAAVSFDDAGSLMAYLQTRGLIAETTFCFDQIDDFRPMAEMVFFGLVPLADVMQFADTMLSAIDLHGVTAPLDGGTLIATRTHTSAANLAEDADALDDGLADDEAGDDAAQTTIATTVAVSELTTTAVGQPAGAVDPS